MNHKYIDKYVFIKWKMAREVKCEKYKMRLCLRFKTNMKWKMLLSIVDTIWVLFYGFHSALSIPICLDLYHLIDDG